jgi:hypothetical protein
MIDFSYCSRGHYCIGFSEHNLLEIRVTFIYVVDNGFWFVLSGEIVSDRDFHKKICIQDDRFITFM